MSDHPITSTTGELPAGFELLAPGTHIAGDGWLLLNHKSLERHSARFETKTEAIREAWSVAICEACHDDVHAAKRTRKAAA